MANGGITLREDDVQVREKTVSSTKSALRGSTLDGAVASVPGARGDGGGSAPARTAAPEGNEKRDGARFGALREIRIARPSSYNGVARHGNGINESKLNDIPRGIRVSLIFSAIRNSRFPSATILPFPLVFFFLLPPLVPAQRDEKNVLPDPSKHFYPAGHCSLA